MADDAASDDRDKPRCLTVLITNIAFAFRSGTEIVVDHLARGLARRGHRPIVFAPHVAGELPEELRRIGIPVVTRLSQVGCTPDIIHGQHNVTTVMALAAFPACPALFSCQDFSAAKDQPPLLPRIRRYLAIDEIRRERLVREGVAPDRIELLYNPVDLERYRRRGRLPERPQRGLVLTKNAGHLAAVRATAQRAGVALDELGPGTGVVVDDLPNRLPQYDLVIATGRMAKEAMAVGCSVALGDERGFAGLVTTDVVAEWRRHNFGGPLLTARLTEDRLLQSIADYDADDAARVTDFIRAEDDLEAHIRRLERIYADIIDDPRSVDPAEEMKALGTFLEDFMISRDFSRPWADLYRNVVGEAADALETALDRHTMKLQSRILDGIEDLGRRLGAHPAGPDHLTRPVDLSISTRHRRAKVNFDGRLSFTTSRRQWDYAVTIACPPITLPSYVEIDAQTDTGSVGFGLNGSDLRKYLGDEIILHAGDGRKLIRIPVAEPSLGPMVLVVRNVAERGQYSRGVIHSATIVAAHA